jgi:hypothetical protein
MMLGSTDFLKLIADNEYQVLLEKGAPEGKLKKDFISLRHSDGRAVALKTPQGLNICPVELHRSIFDDFLAASLIRQDRAEDKNSRIVFKLTIDGIARGLSIDYDAQANVAMWDEPGDDGLMGATVVFDGISFAEAVRRVIAMPIEKRAQVASIGTHARLFELALIEAISRRNDFPWS